MHNWGDEACVKILKNCRKAIPEKTGKVIIVDMVLKPDGNELFDETGLAFDLVMMVNTEGGKERTELEWKKILEKGASLTTKLSKFQLYNPLSRLILSDGWRILISQLKYYVYEIKKCSLLVKLLHCST